MPSKIVNKVPYPLAKSDVVSNPQIIRGWVGGLEGTYAKYRRCWHCKTYYNTVKNSLRCEEWHEGVIDEKGNLVSKT